MLRRCILKKINNKNARNVIPFVKHAQWYQQFVQVVVYNYVENLTTINVFACKDIMKLANYLVFNAHKHVKPV